jgi:AGCS family alanine or glycine:cation symporter
MVFCRMPQIRLFPKALGQFLRSLGKENSSSYRSLCTALAATVGTGNIAGVAGAIALGGPGALFWMWLGAFLGMGVKFAEGTLAVAFR